MEEFVLLDDIGRPQNISNPKIVYSDGYLKKQIDLAYQNGVADCMRKQIKFHHIEPFNEECAKSALESFWQLFNETYEQLFTHRATWRVQK